MFTGLRKGSFALQCWFIFLNKSQSILYFKKFQRKKFLSNFFLQKRQNFWVQFNLLGYCNILQYCTYSQVRHVLSCIKSFENESCNENYTFPNRLDDKINQKYLISIIHIHLQVQISPGYHVYEHLASVLYQCIS